MIFVWVMKINLAHSLELYETDDTFLNWKQLTLNASGTAIDETPCKKYQK
jgi:hypothetical protein